MYVDAEIDGYMRMRKSSKCVRAWVAWRKVPMMMTTMTVGILGTKQHDTKTQPKDKTPGKTEGKSVPGGSGGNTHTTTTKEKSA